MLADFRIAFRQLLKSPGYTAVVVLTLAFGIAVNTTIFGTVATFFFTRMPVPDSERLVLLLQRSSAWSAPHAVSFPDFEDYREQVRGLESLNAYLPLAAHLSAGTEAPRRAWVEVVTPGAFAALGVSTNLGRLLLPSDGETPGHAPVVVLSYSCWQERFGGRPSVVGETVRLNNRPFAVVGVAPESFTGFSPFLAVQGFVPTGALDSLRDDGAGMLDWRNASMWKAIGKLAPGATLESVRAETAVVTGNLLRDHPASHVGVSSVVIPERNGRPDPTVSDLLPAFGALFSGLVLLVLVIACANVANLMFARTLARRKEFTVRAALGATRWRLVRQLLAESLLLAAVAGVAGALLADWAAPLLQQISQQNDLPVTPGSGPGWSLRLFTVAIAFLAGIGSGLFPALRASRTDLVADLKEGSGASDTRHRLRDLFVVAQVVFSLVVLIFAGVFLRSLRQARAQDLGIRHDNTLLASFDLSLQRYSSEESRRFCGQVLERIRALPGCEAATVSSSVPFDYSIWLHDTVPDNPSAELPQGLLNAGTATVAPGFERQFGLRLLAGRHLEETDTTDVRRVAVVNHEYAERSWPGLDPLGRRFRPWKDGPEIEVVGVVATAKYYNLAEAPRPFYYTPLGQDFETAPFTLAVRTRNNPAAHAAAIRAVLAEIDPHLPVFNVRTMAELFDSSIFAFMPLRLGAALAGAQGLIGLGLAIMGLYSVVAFGVNQRAREIGIRMALGAEGSSVVWQILRSGLRLTLLGVAAGLVLSLGIGLALAHILVGIRPLDLVAVGSATALLVGTAVLACWLPARRATRIDPTEALRSQ